ncbi:hypothetical protein SteCoe_33614 [Stentor coeruleus]|uniref:Uncharacterized protein n=1 Tax=Stentor coeruleus TaxID=5963 RepID=A0A1R2AWP7_9CILI|nr:hypothetical protein SteCoe_33614 [Stentor coeruleus]
MGCANSKEFSHVFEIKDECTRLMQENLNSLTVIEYLLLENSRQSLALRLISLKKRLEEYYKILSKYRNFWISKAKKEVESTPESTILAECEQELNKERHQLNKTKKTLLKVINNLKENWNDNYSTVEDLKDSIENNPEILHKSTMYYENYYTESKDYIKNKANEIGGKLKNDDLDIYESIKAITIDLYKTPETRVYYTPDIKPIEKRKAHKPSSGPVKDDTIQELKSFEETTNRITVIEKEGESNEIKNITQESDSEIISSGLESFEDEEELRERLSYTQK